MSGRAGMSWVGGFVGRYRRRALLALALGVLAAACSALLMFTSGWLISATALAGTALFAIMVPVACVQLFGLGRPAARYLERLASHDWVLRVTSDLRQALYRAVCERTGDPARERAAGEYLGLLADDVAHLQDLYLRVVFPTAVTYLVAGGAAAFFGFFSAPFALVMLASFVVVAVLAPLACLFVTRGSAERVRGLRAEEYARLTDDVQGAVDWVLAGRGEEVRERHAVRDREVRALEARVRLAQRAFTLASMATLAVLACVVVAWAGGRFAGDVNWIAAFALGFFPLVEVLAVLPAAFSEVTGHLASIGRLGEFVGDAAGDEKLGRGKRLIADETFPPPQLLMVG